MENLKSILGGNGGKVRIAAIVLGVIIATTLAAWIIILFIHFEQGGTFPTIPHEPEIDAQVSEDGDAADVDGESALVGDGVLYGPPVPPNIYVTPEEKPFLTEIRLEDAYFDIFCELDNIAEKYGVVSAAVTVYDGYAGEGYTYTYGYSNIEAGVKADLDTKYCVASLSKLVTAICVMNLVDRELIDLDSDVSNYFGYRVENPNFPDTPITARMLLYHTSSIFDSGLFEESLVNASSVSVKDLVEEGSSFRRSNPGMRYEYSDFGYAILGSLCERVTGKLFDTMAREVVFKPLDIDAAFVPVNLYDTQNIAVLYNSEHRATRSVLEQLSTPQSVYLGSDLHLAHNNLTISAFDYAKILAMLGNGGSLGDAHILSEASVYEMHRANVEGPGYMQALAPRYSYDGFVENEAFYWHPGSLGGMFSQYISYRWGSNRGVVVITTGATTAQRENGMIDVCTELSHSAWKVYYEEPGAPEQIAILDGR